jgi:hypothetical protein
VVRMADPAENYFTAQAKLDALLVLITHPRRLHRMVVLVGNRKMAYA